MRKALMLCAIMILTGTVSGLGCGNAAGTSMFALNMPAGTPTTGGPLALINGLIIDGTGREPIVGGAVVVAEGRIIAVGRTGEVPIPAGCETVDLHGAAVTPGLINAHVHNAYSQENALQWAQSGVTTVRDLSCGRDEVAKALAFRDRARVYPQLCRIVSAGAMIAARRGYQANYGIVVGSEADLRNKVAGELEAGVDCVKITLQAPTFFRPGTLSSDRAKLIVALAHARNVPVSAHIGTAGDLGIALDSGVDDVAHLTPDTLTPALIDRMVSGHIYLEPTLNNWAVGANRARVLANLGRFVRAGGRVALGVEYIPSARLAGPFVGMPLAELLMMQEAGMTPMQIITASTLNAARVCRLEAILGTLEPGKMADILIIDGDPLAELRNLARVKMVIHSGVVIRREA